MVDIVAISGASVTAINRNIYVELKNMGWNVEMIIPEKFPVSPTAYKQADPLRSFDPVTHLLPLKGKNPRLFTYPALYDTLSKLKPSFVLLENDPVSKLAIDAGIWCKKNHAQLLCLSCENLSFDLIPTLKRRGMKSLPAALVKSLLHWRARPLVNTVFTINDEGTGIFQRKGYQYVTKIPLGFDPAVFFPGDSARQKIRGKLNLKHPAIAYFGRLVPEKGVHLLIEALGQLKESNWHFMLDKFDLYANEYNQEISDLITKHGIQDRVVYIEADHYEIAAYMNAADVVVIPSVSTPEWKEQYGRVAPEAMACGKLVIAARSGALPELIGDAGLIFKEGDVNELVSLLRSYLDGSMDFLPLMEKAAARAYNVLSIPMQAGAYNNRMRNLQSSPVAGKA